MKKLRNNLYQCLLRISRTWHDQRGLETVEMLALLGGSLALVIAVVLVVNARGDMVGDAFLDKVVEMHGVTATTPSSANPVAQPLTVATPALSILAGVQHVVLAPSAFMFRHMTGVARVVLDPINLAGFGAVLLSAVALSMRVRNTSSILTRTDDHERMPAWLCALIGLLIGLLIVACSALIITLALYLLAGVSLANAIIAAIALVITGFAALDFWTHSRQPQTRSWLVIRDESGRQLRP